MPRKPDPRRQHRIAAATFNDCGGLIAKFRSASAANIDPQEVRPVKPAKETVIAGIVLAVIVAAAVIWFMPAGLRQAPPLVGQTLDGRTLTLAQLRGKPVLVTFWATTCPSCIEEMPHLIELYRELNPKGLEIIGVAMAYDPPEQVRTLVRQRQIPYPVVLDSEEHIAREFDNVRVTPTSVLISPEGRIVHYRLGLLDLPKLRETIREML
ncbi:MAG TPA: TlpA family protein disulfide reductase [Xanthomonadaceae bacterium]|nr:TlpA family protein disulfide reductase [Xanthomonadaceae bacterium]